MSRFSDQLESERYRLARCEERLAAADAQLAEARAHGSATQLREADGRQRALAYEREELRRTIADMTRPPAPRQPTVAELWLQHAEACTRIVNPMYGKWQSDAEAERAYVAALRGQAEPTIPYYQRPRNVPLDALARVAFCLEILGRGLPAASGIAWGYGLWQLHAELLGRTDVLTDRHVAQQPFGGEELSAIVHACRDGGPAMLRAQALAGRSYNHQEAIAKVRGWPTQPAPQPPTSGRTTP